MIVKMVTVYLGHSLVLWTVYGQFIFGQFFGLAYISQGLYFQGSSLCFSFFCLLVSSVSVFCPDTRGTVVDNFFFQAHLFSHAVRREGCCKQIILACAHSVSATLGLPPLTVHTPQALGCSTGNSLRLALGCMHLPGLSCSGSGTRVVLRGTDSVGPAFCALPRSKQLR